MSTEILHRFHVAFGQGVQGHNAVITFRGGEDLERALLARVIEKLDHRNLGELSFEDLAEWLFANAPAPGLTEVEVARGDGVSSRWRGRPAPN